MPPCSMLTAMQVANAAAGLYASCRQLLVQPHRIALKQPQVLDVNRKVSIGDCTNRVVNERRQMNGPSLALEVSLDAVVLVTIGLGCPDQRRRLRVVDGLLYKCHYKVYNRHRACGVVVDLQVWPQRRSGERGYRLVDPQLNPVRYVAGRRSNGSLNDLEGYIVASVNGIQSPRAVVEHMRECLRPRAS
uniref:Uncharacterized protein n=1 Tax=Peronospora matthiolae TaxID=2874970 RepID=A0AAV1U1A8_9STRA